MAKQKLHEWFPWGNTVLHLIGHTDNIYWYSLTISRPDTTKELNNWMTTVYSFLLLQTLAGLILMEIFSGVTGMHPTSFSSDIWKNWKCEIVLNSEKVQLGTFRLLTFGFAINDKPYHQQERQTVSVDDPAQSLFSSFSCQAFTSFRCTLSVPRR